MTTTIYRQSREFPPEQDSYVTAFERRLQRGQTPYSNPIFNKASRGLSVISNLKSARNHARANKRLGTILVRYHIPEVVQIELEHLTGKNSGHLTLFMNDLASLSEYLDMDWWEVQDFNPETAG